MNSHPLPVLVCLKAAFNISQPLFSEGFGPDDTKGPVSAVVVKSTQLGCWVNKILVSRFQTVCHQQLLYHLCHSSSPTEQVITLTSYWASRKSDLSLICVNCLAHLVNVGCHYLGLTYHLYYVSYSICGWWMSAVCGYNLRSVNLTRSS